MASKDSKHLTYADWRDKMAPAIKKRFLPRDEAAQATGGKEPTQEELNELVASVTRA